MTTSSPPADPRTYRAFVPVKSWERAKTRLGLPAQVRARLARAFAADTLAALTGSAGIDEVVVVTDNPTARTDLPAGDWDVLVDTDADGLNDALVRAATHPAYAGGHAVVVVCADLPALRGTDVDTLLAAARTSARDWFVSDAQEVGTTILASADGTGFRPAFGDASRAVHAARGWQDLSAPAPERVRRDVDTIADLRAASALGLGPATLDVVADLGLDLDLG